MKRKNKIIILSTIIFLILITLTFITYGYYLTKINGNKNKSISVSLANLELTYNDGNGLIESKNVVPGDNITTKEFSVENTGDKKVVNYAVYLDDVVNTFVDKYDIKLTLTCESSKNNTCNGTNMLYPTSHTLLVLNDIDVGEIQKYYLKVDFIETNDDQSDNMDKIVEGNIIIRDLKETGSTEEVVNGTDSVILDNPKLISDYKIYGSSVQNGTPTVDSPVEIESVGDLVTEGDYKNKYEISMILGGENLHNINTDTIGTMYDNEGNIINNNNIFVTDYLFITSKNTKIKLTGTNNIKSVQNIRVNFFDNNKIWLSQSVIPVNASENFDKDITVPTNAKSIRISFAKDNEEEFEINEFYTTSIYLDEPLRKIGEYADYIDFKNKKVIRNVYKESIIPSYVSSNTGTYTGFLADITKVPKEYSLASEKNNGICLSDTHKYMNVVYKNTNQYSNICGIYKTTTNVYRVVFTMGDSSIKTLEQVLTVLPKIDILYPLETVIEENIDLPQINGNTIKILTKTSPSNIEVTYIK